MEKFIPYEKASKKQQRELDRKKRGSWGCISPVTRAADTSKNVYSRKEKHRAEYARFD